MGKTEIEPGMMCWLNNKHLVKVIQVINVNGKQDKAVIALNKGKLGSIAMVDWLSMKGPI